MADVPDTLDFAGSNTPSRVEANIVDRVDQGTIPKNVEGAFYRIQPDPQFPPLLWRAIAFQGDVASKGLNA
jgi:hypothetical protein